MALHQAAMEGHAAAVKELLAAGVDKDVPDKVRWACMCSVRTCVRLCGSWTDGEP